MTNTTDVNDFLMAGGAPSAKFPTVGTVVKGTIIDSTTSQQTDVKTNEPLFWPDGKPKMQAILTLQTDERDPEITDDDGTRRLYVKGNMQYAVRDAIAAAGCKGIDIGGTLAVKYERDGEKTNPAFNAPKVYVAQYLPPAPSTDSANDLLGTSSPESAPAAQSAASLI